MPRKYVRKTAKDRDEKTGQFLKGNQSRRRHGARSRQPMPLKIRRYAECMKASLIRDLGPREENLTAAELILIDRAMSLLKIIHVIEDFVNKNGAFSGRKLDPILGVHYLSYTNSLRLLLRELGISKRVGDQILTIEALSDEIDKDKETKKG